MITKINTFIKKNLKVGTDFYEILMYLITGGLTTVVSLGSFYLFATPLSFDYRWANFISWILSVTFAYITNRRFVFKSQEQGGKEILREFLSFTGFRVLSFVIDLGLLVLLVELFSWQSFIAKIATNVVVFILNYLFSKFIVFSKSKR